MNTKDFPSLAQGKALPYGVYDTGQNRAVVNVGVTHDTAEFAVENIVLCQWSRSAVSPPEQCAKSR